MEISVLIPAYNAERFVLPCVQSILAQTFEDFELIVVNDCSTDRTAEILGSVADPRLRVLHNDHNLGVVGALNRAMATARGRYIARIDSDDIATPTRFAKQKVFLDANPDIALLATEMSVLSGSRVQFSRLTADLDPLVVRWMLHLDNPVGCPSMMFRAEAVHRLGTYMSESMRYAEDFDFSHRILEVGEISVLPEYLTIYRHHDHNMTRVYREKVAERAEAVLRWVYAKLFDGPVDDGAGLVARHILTGSPVESIAEFDRLRDFLDLLRGRFHARYRPSAAQVAAADRFTARHWSRLVHRSLVAGELRKGWHARAHGPNGVVPTANTVMSAGAGLLRAARPPMRALKQLVSRKTSLPAKPFVLGGTQFRSLPNEPDHPPTLYVVVDTEAEFDWSAPMARSETRVTSAGHQHLAQRIFDGHGIRPIYVVDYAIASQRQGYEPLREILERHGCMIGAHLHPWTTPPFEEEVSERNSFAGNLPPGLEERKLETLVATIEANFRVKPLFFKAGRYGLSGDTLGILGRLGLPIDFSIIPLADLRPQGGPDFRRADAFAYRTDDSSVMSIPMMRGQAGLLSPLPLPVHAAINSRAGRRLHLPSFLSRTGLLNTATLTPEGMTVSEQIALIRTMAGRGHRTFVLHYHSPSLGAHTPYVRNERQLTTFLQNIDDVCRFFIRTFGGLAGNPVDLLPPNLRELAWPPSTASLPVTASTRS